MTPDKLELQEIKHQIVSLVCGFCSHQINDEYADLCEKLVNKIARKKTAPLASGQVQIWAAAVVHAIGTINFLFDKNTKPYISPDEICQYFDVSKSTITQKSKLIRDMFKMWHYDAEFSTQHMLKNNPMARISMVNGYLVMNNR